MKQTITVSADLKMHLMECGECGVLFAVSVAFYKETRHHNNGWYCPNGHSRIWVDKSGEERLKELESELNNVIEQRQWWQEEAETKARSLTATKGHLTKLKKRIAGGACPVCKRQFVNLQRHMAGQHPHFHEEPTP